MHPFESSHVASLFFFLFLLTNPLCSALICSESNSCSNTKFTFNSSESQSIECSGLNTCGDTTFLFVQTSSSNSSFPVSITGDAAAQNVNVTVFGSTRIPTLDCFAHSTCSSLVWCYVSSSMSLSLSFCMRVCVCV